MSCGRTSWLTNVIRPPIPINTSLGLTPLAPIVTVAVSGGVLGAGGAIGGGEGPAGGGWRATTATACHTGDAEHRGGKSGQIPSDAHLSSSGKPHADAISVDCRFVSVPGRCERFTPAVSTYGGGNCQRDG